MFRAAVWIYGHRVVVTKMWSIGAKPLMNPTLIRRKTRNWAEFAT